MSTARKNVLFQACEKNKKKKLNLTQYKELTQKKKLIDFRGGGLEFEQEARGRHERANKGDHSQPLERRNRRSGRTYAAYASEEAVSATRQHLALGVACPGSIEVICMRAKPT